MIRLAAIAALSLVPAAAYARDPARPMPPQAPQPPQPPQQPHPPRVHGFEVELPDFSDLAEILADLPALPGMESLIARAAPPPPPDEDEDGEEADKDVQDEHGVRVYRMNREHLLLPRLRIRERGGDEREERDATAQASGRGRAALPMKGPVTFQVRAQAGDIDVVATDRAEVSVSVSEAPADDIALYAFGDRVEPSFHGRRLLRRGKLHVELPRGSRLDVTTLSGDVSAQRVAEARVRTMSGEVKLGGVGRAEVQSISGDVHLHDVAGPVRLHLVSGRATVQTSGAAPQVEFQSASGSLDWNGTCAKDCHLSAETVSGELRLSVDPRSSFELSYSSHSGELRDEANLSVKRTLRRRHGMASGFLEATYGKGEGVIEADAFSGNLSVKKK